MFEEKTKNQDNNAVTTISKADLQAILESVVRAARAPSALEEKKMNDEIERERRRTLLMVELGKAEEQKLNNRKNGCSHSRAPQGAKNAGQAVTRGTGEWTTGGQLTGRDLATLVCSRCGWMWQFKPTPAELDYIESNGMLGMTPPPAERIVAEG